MTSTASNLAEHAATDSVRYITYLYFTTERDPRRGVLETPDTAEARACLRQLLAQNKEAYGAELWLEDRLMLRLRSPLHPLWKMDAL